MYSDAWATAVLQRFEDTYPRSAELRQMMAKCIPGDEKDALRVFWLALEQVLSRPDDVSQRLWEEYKGLVKYKGPRTAEYDAHICKVGKTLLAMTCGVMARYLQNLHCTQLEIFGA